MHTFSKTSGSEYAMRPGAYDEACDESGQVRAHYASLLDCLAGLDLDDLTRCVAHDLHSRGATFGGSGGETPFRVDPVPRLIEADEWAEVERGVAQRVRALNAFLADVYSGQRIVEAGRVPKLVVESAVDHDPWMRDVPVPHGVYAGAVGLDLVRCEDGRLHVLEDNARTPSGYMYLLAARDVLDERLPEAATEIDTASVGDIVERLGDALWAAAPDGVDEPHVVMLSDGPSNSAWWEHEGIARQLEIPVVTLGDLEARDRRVHARIDGSLRQVDVIYRRTDDDMLEDDEGRPTPLAEVLLEPLRHGRVAVFNSFGTGVADDKLTHAYVPEMIDFYLGEEPLLPSVETLDLADPGDLASALDRLDDLVIKERAGEGGYGVTIFAHASREKRDEVTRELRRRPQDFIAQRRVTLSTHPTVIDGRLAPRHIDLRPFALQSGDDVHVVPGGLTRVAFGDGALVVNSSQNGGGKDTWVLR
jgi:uncharacterized circularly permuted ATP-grasp superfamily protein